MDATQYLISKIDTELINSKWTTKSFNISMRQLNIDDIK